MKFEEIFNETCEEIGIARQEIDRVLEIIPDPEGSYLPSIVYSLSIGDLWLNELKNNILANNEKKNIVEDKEEIREEEEVLLEEIAEEEDFELEVAPLEVDLKELEDRLDEVLMKYNEALYYTVNNGLRFHAFLANTVNQHLREASFNLQFEKQRIKDYEGN